MKTILNSLITCLIIGLSIQSAIAQNVTKPTSSTNNKYSYQKRATDTIKNTDFSLNGQFQFMLARSKSSFGAKVINPVRLNSLWKSVTDTLKKERTALKAANIKVLEHEKTIADLKAEVTGKENTLLDANAKVDEINFLGISFNKVTYNLIVWSIIIILGLALFIVIARSAKNILEAKHRTQLYDEISAEFQAYKSKANEQQRKLARELQDERNIIEEMKNKGR